MNDNPKIIAIPKSRLVEATRQAAAETTLDIYKVLQENGGELTPGMRTLFLNAIHTTMTLAVVDLLNAHGYSLEDG